MKVIKGLIIKDLLQLKSYSKSLIIFIFLFIVSALSYNEGKELLYILPVMISLGFGMFAIASFSYDSLAKSDKYFLAMPFTRKELVLEKYVLASGLTLCGSIVGAIISLIMINVRNFEISNVSDIAISIATAVTTISIFQSIQIPNIYKYGIEKGKINSFITAALFVVIGIVLLYIGNYSNIDLSFLNNLNEIITAVGIFIVAFIAYFISYKISMKIMNKKDF